MVLLRSVFSLARWGQRLKELEAEDNKRRKMEAVEYTWTFQGGTQAGNWMDTLSWPQMNYSCRKLAHWKLVIQEVRLI